MDIQEIDAPMNASSQNPTINTMKSDQITKKKYTTHRKILFMQG
jgi:hypothetical protein